MDPDAPLSTTVSDTATVLSGRFDALSRGLGRYIRLWPEIVGQAMADHTMPTGITEDALRIRCESSIWTSELMHLQVDIVARLHAVVGPCAPTKIAPYTGRLPREAAIPKAPAPAPLPPLPEAQIAAIYRITSGIEDDDVRARMIRAMIATSARAQAE